MYCQSCGTKNPEDARFCKACGTPIAGPGDKGGPIVDDTVEVMETLPDKNLKALDAATDTVEDSPAKGSGAKRKKSPAKETESKNSISLRSGSPRLSIADGEMPDSTISRMSISLAEMGIQSPRRTGFVAVGIAAVLVAVGALGMYAVVLATRPDQATVASVPEPSLEPVRMSIGFPERDPGDIEEEGGAESPSRPATAKRPPGGGVKAPAAGSEGSPATGSGGKAPASEGGSAGGTKAPASGGGSAGGEDGEEPRSSSTTVEAPSEPGGDTGGSSAGGSETPGSGERHSFNDPLSLPGGDVQDTRDLEMDRYAGDVRSVIRRFYAPRAGNCYDRATRNNPSLRGTVIVGFTIGVDGNVSRTTVSHNTTGDDTLGRCIAGQVSTWRLPPPPRNAPVRFEMPFSW